MAKGIFITGTDTDIGKTYVSAGLVYLMNKNKYRTGYFKPVLSGAIEKDGELIPGDTDFVTSLAGLEKNYEKISPYIYRTAVSPHLAAEIEKRPIDIDYIKECFSSVKKDFDYILVEGSGGLAVPYNREGYLVVDMIKDLNLDIIVVANAGLGMINHTVQTCSYARAMGLTVQGVIVNQYVAGDICQEDNLRTLKEMDIAEILAVVPENPDVKEAFSENIDIEKIRETFQEI